MKNKTLLLIFLFAAVLRFLLLDRFPVSLNWDEVSHGYNAYSILTTGKDEWGSFLPYIFRAFGDYKLPVYIYATVLPIAVFGLNAFAVRFISALAGSLSVIGIYLLANHLFPDRVFKLRKTTLTIGHAAAFFLAILPWHFFISRPALEANLGLALVIFGFAFFLRGLIHPKSFIPAGILLGLSLHTYNSDRVFVPLLLAFAIFFYRKRITLSKPAIFALLLFLSSLAIVFYQVKTGEGTARYQKLAILSEDRVFQIGEARQLSSLPPLVARLVHNRPVFFAKTFLVNYLGYFSPAFFTQSKGAQSQFAIPGENLIGVAIFFLFFLGIATALKDRKKLPGVIFVFTWLALAPVAAALTYDPPQALRPNPMIPAIILIAALGFTVVASLKKRALIAIFIALPLVEFSVYLTNYFGLYAKNYSASWQYGHQQVFDYLKQYPDKTIIMTKKQGEPHIFYAFYNKLDPRILQDENRSLRFAQSNWFWTDRIDNVYFVNDWDIPTISVDRLFLESGGSVKTEDAYLVTSPDRVPVNSSIVKEINYLDGTPAFVIAKF